MVQEPLIYQNFSTESNIWFHPCNPSYGWLCWKQKTIYGFCGNELYSKYSLFIWPNSIYHWAIGCLITCSSRWQWLWVAEDHWLLKCSFNGWEVWIPEWRHCIQCTKFWGKPNQIHHLASSHTQTASAHLFCRVCCCDLFQLCCPVLIWGPGQLFDLLLCSNHQSSESPSTCCPCGPSGFQHIGT